MLGGPQPGSVFLAFFYGTFLRLLGFSVFFGCFLDLWPLSKALDWDPVVSMFLMQIPAKTFGKGRMKMKVTIEMISWFYIWLYILSSFQGESEKLPKAAGFVG